VYFPVSLELHCTVQEAGLHLLRRLARYEKHEFLLLIMNFTLRPKTIVVSAPVATNLLKKSGKRFLFSRLFHDFRGGSRVIIWWLTSRIKQCCIAVTSEEGGMYHDNSILFAITLDFGSFFFLYIECWSRFLRCAATAVAQYLVLVDLESRKSSGWSK